MFIVLRPIYEFINRPRPIYEVFINRRVHKSAWGRKIRFSMATLNPGLAVVTILPTFIDSVARLCSFILITATVCYIDADGYDLIATFPCFRLKGPLIYEVFINRPRPIYEVSEKVVRDQGGGYPMYIREGGVPDVHISWPVCDIPVICDRFSDL